jgi:hypothetical protein
MEIFVLAVILIVAIATVDLPDLDSASISRQT